MPHPENGSRRYGVYYSKVVGDSLRELQRRASREGRGKAFASAFRRIVAALQKNPNQLGEPQYRLPGLRL